MKYGTVAGRVVMAYSVIWFSLASLLMPAALSAPVCSSLSLFTWSSVMLTAASTLHNRYARSILQCSPHAADARAHNAAGIAHTA